MKEISRNERDLLIKKGLVKHYTFRCPVYDESENIVGFKRKTVIEDIVITKNKYYTKDSLADKIRSHKK